MIMSFSVPENSKYSKLIDWYNTADKQERSRQFRDIFLSYIAKPHHTMESKVVTHVSQPIALERVEIVSGNTNDDLDLRIDSIATLL